MKKVIFLDFDGVLQNGKMYNLWKNRKEVAAFPSLKQYGFFFDADCVNCLQTLVEQTNAKIVISSSWRSLGWERMNELWDSYEMPGRLIDMIPLKDAQSTGGREKLKRGECIEMWLQNHPVDAYVILDDNDEMLANQQAQFVQTKTYRGFCEADLEKAINILN